MPSQTFAYRADGLLAGLTVAGARVLADGSGYTLKYDYTGFGALQQRTAPWKTVVAGFNTGGQVNSLTSSVNEMAAGHAALTPVLTETPSWSTEARLGGYTESGNGFQENRVYKFDARDRLTEEPVQVQAGAAVRKLQYTFDGGAGGGLGVRTKAAFADSTTDYWQAKTPGAASTDVLERPLSQTFSGALESHLTSASPLNHPALIDSYDADGNLVKRDFSGKTPEVQVLTWDELGRLAQVSYRAGSKQANFAGAVGEDFKIVYDALGRRLKTSEVKIKVNSVGGVANTAAPFVVGSWYDPQVEFLEVAVEVNGERYWKAYGPDTTGGRGGLQGIGGLEAFLHERDSVCVGMLGNLFGDTPAWCTADPGATGTWSVQWNPARVSSYGPLAGTGLAPILSATTMPWAATLWRGKRQDPTSLYWLGARYYDPAGGRFISPDPLGHGSSMSLYDFCDGDPVNGSDPDGRACNLDSNNSTLSGVRFGLESSVNTYPFSFGYSANLPEVNAFQLVSHAGGMQVDLDGGFIRGGKGVYGPANSGLELTQNAGWSKGEHLSPGIISGSPDAVYPNTNIAKETNWFGVVTDTGKQSGNPVIQSASEPNPGFYVTQTSIRDTSFRRTDQRSYVNSFTVDYAVTHSKDEIGMIGTVVDNTNGDYAQVIYADFGPRWNEASVATTQSFIDVAHVGSNGRWVSNVPKNSTRFTYFVYQGSAQTPGWPLTYGQIDAMGNAYMNRSPAVLQAINDGLMYYVNNHHKQ